MEPIRTFVGWKQPLLVEGLNVLRTIRPPQPAAWDQSTTVWNLEDLLIVTPSARAGRRLLELLADRAQSPSSPCVLIPPMIITISGITSAFLRSSFPIADDMAQTFAWCHALGELRSEERLRLAPLGWSESPVSTLDLASRLSGLMADLRNEEIEPDEVASIAGNRQSMESAAIWQTLAAADRRARDYMHEAGLEVPSLLSRSISAGAPKYRSVVLLGVTELPKSMRRLLLHPDISVHSIVHAPAVDESYFDSFGCPRPDRWAHRPIDIDDEVIVAARDHRCQAMEALRFIGDRADQFSIDEYTVGLGDLTVHRTIQRFIEGAGVPTHSAYGRSLATARPLLLLRALAEYASSEESDTLAALLRHPDAENLLDRHASGRSLLTLLDFHRAKHLPRRIDAAISYACKEKKELEALVRTARRLAGSVSQSVTDVRIAADNIERLLLAAYGAADHSSIAREYTETLQTELKALASVLQRLSMLPAALAEYAPIRGSDVIRWLTRMASRIPIPETYKGPSVELVNWFELSSDDAPVKIITGMNNGSVPEMPAYDPLLSESLRSALGLPGTEVRYARDAHALSAICASTPKLRIVWGKTSVDGSALAPSRLLFAVDDKTLVTRANQAFTSHDSIPPSIPVLFPSAATSVLVMPRPSVPEPPITHLRVTAFKDYIACKYRFYLRHVLGLQALDDEARELDGAGFGSLLHTVIGEFARSDRLTSVEPNAVVEELYQRLDSLVKATYGAERSIYLEQQLRHIRIRLMRYAEFHCKRSLDGWRTKEEWIEVDAEKDLVVDDIPFRIQGRIDRIEYRDDTNEYAILDLKTSDRRTVPEESHRQGPRNAKVWTDLQLPLYRQIAPIPSGSSIKVGYILLDGAEDRPPLAIADWTDADYASALDRAEEIIRGVRAGVFWPPSMVVPTWDDDLSSICMDRSPYRQALIARAPSIWG